MLSSRFSRVLLVPVIAALGLIACRNSESGDKSKMTADSVSKVAFNEPAVTYAWSQNKGLAAGTYKVEVTDANGATAPETKKDEGREEENDKSQALLAKPQVKTPDKIIKTGQLDIEVDDYKKARAEVDAIVKKMQGYISHEDENGSSYAMQTSIQIRVPAAAFDALMGGLSGIAKTVRTRSVNVADVSEEYYDVEARKTAQQAAVQRYVELLKQAKTVGEVMEVQAKIDEIQEEVEAKEGRLRVINDQVGYSTVSLTMTKNYGYVAQDSPGFWNRIGNAFGDGWQGMQNLFIVLAKLWPLWIILGIVFWITRRVVRRIMKCKTT